jgi:RNA polymerase sigma-70 factor (ECF subfamily)
MTEPSTAELVLKAKSGDREAFGKLADRYRPRLLRQVEARMGAGVRMKLEVEDVLQETFACALESIGKFVWEGEDSFYLWLAGIAEHVISNAARKKGGRPLNLPFDPAWTGASPSKNLRREERFQRLEGAVRRLSADHREVLRLARFEGLKVQEIATLMRRSPNAVYKLLARALEELRKDIGDTGSLHLPDRPLKIEEPEDDR